MVGESKFGYGRKSIEPFIPTSPIDCIFPITP